MLANFDFDVIARTWQVLIFQGLAFTAQVTVMAMVGGIILGTLLAMMRLSSIKPLSWLAAGYVNGLRSIPLVLVIFWFYFLVPYIGAWIIGSPTPVKVGAFTSALVTFILFEACYYCEIMRAGIQSIPSGQASAGYALGLNYWQVMAQVVLPQAFRNMTPVLLTQTIVLFQDVSLVHHLVARLRHHRQQDRPARRPADRDVCLRGGGLPGHLPAAVILGQTFAGPHRHRALRK